MTLHAFAVLDNVSITIQGPLTNPNARKIGMYEDGTFVAFTFVASSGPCKFADMSCRAISRAKLTNIVSSNSYMSTQGNMYA